MLRADQRVDKSEITISGDPLSIEQASDVGCGEFVVRVTRDDQVLHRVTASSQIVDKAVGEGQSVYGVTTGFGGMANIPISGDQATQSQENLLNFLAAGAGPAIDPKHVRTAMLLRANVLLRGCSGVRLQIVERLARFLNADAIPVVRELGSIGASGDLIPLATIARAVIGHPQHVRVQLKHAVVDGNAALHALKLEPLQLRPKEALAMVNGTSFSAAISANCVAEAKRLLAVAVTTQAIMLRALQVQMEPFDEFVQHCKPHPGQVWAATMMRQLLDTGRGNEKLSNPQASGVQDRYSLRCFPQFIAPIVEGISRIQTVVETEMNSVSDNPLIDIEGERFYQSGNFLGQSIAMAMDDLRRFLGLLAKHLDVQIAQLVAPEFNKGLPSSLRGSEELAFNMGLKGLQITGNSIMPLLTFYANPLVEHFPTHAEQFNQNVNGLSWGAANLAWKSVNLFQQYAALSLIFAVQAIDLRAKLTRGHYDGRAELGETCRALYDEVYYASGATPGEKTRPFLLHDADQCLETQLAELASRIAHPSPIVRSVAPVMESFDEHFSG